MMHAVLEGNREGGDLLRLKTELAQAAGRERQEERADSLLGEAVAICEARLDLAQPLPRLTRLEAHDYRSASRERREPAENKSRHVRSVERLGRSRRRAETREPVGRVRLGCRAGDALADEGIEPNAGGREGGIGGIPKQGRSLLAPRPVLKAVPVGRALLEQVLRLGEMTGVTPDPG